jgi:hypothetical protein
MASKKTTKTAPKTSLNIAAEAEASKATKTPKATTATTKTEPKPALKAKAAPKTAAKGKAEPKQKRVSLLDAAAALLARTRKAMTCKEIFETVAAEGTWSSPNGKTPAATLYTAVTMLPNCAPRGGINKRAG